MPVFKMATGISLMIVARFASIAYFPFWKKNSNLLQGKTQSPLLAVVIGRHRSETAKLTEGDPDER